PRRCGVKEARVVAALWPLLRRHRGTVALLALTGCAASLCEGVGVTLFVPLLYSLQPGGFTNAPDGIGRAFERLLAGVPEADRFPWLVAAMLVLLLAKCLLTAAGGLLFARLDARLLHELRAAIFARLLRVRQSWLDRQRAG